MKYLPRKTFLIAFLVSSFVSLLQASYPADAIEERFVQQHTTTLTIAGSDPSGGAGVLAVRESEPSIFYFSQEDMQKTGRRNYIKVEPTYYRNPYFFLMDMVKLITRFVLISQIIRYSYAQSNSQNQKLCYEGGFCNNPASPYEFCKDYKLTHASRVISNWPGQDCLVPVYDTVTASGNDFYYGEEGKRYFCKCKKVEEAIDCRLGNRCISIMYKWMAYIGSSSTEIGQSRIGECVPYSTSDEQSSITYVHDDGKKCSYKKVQEKVFCPPTDIYIPIGDPVIDYQNCMDYTCHSSKFTLFPQLASELAAREECKKTITGTMITTFIHADRSKIDIPTPPRQSFDVVLKHLCYRVENIDDSRILEDLQLLVINSDNLCRLEHAAPINKISPNVKKESIIRKPGAWQHDDCQHLSWRLVDYFIETSSSCHNYEPRASSIHVYKSVEKCNHRKCRITTWKWWANIVTNSQHDYERPTGDCISSNDLSISSCSDGSEETYSGNIFGDPVCFNTNIPKDEAFDQC
ncbi:MAG: hypothetical protein ACK4V2_02840 [Pseudomonadota bacterium]|jgi:hypothetical protein